MQIGSPGSMSLIEGGSHSISRSKIAEDSKADPTGESLGVLPEARSAPTDIIGNVESTSDGRLGVIVSATVVGRAPPSGLILQVQVKPTDGRGAETGDDVADRVRKGLSPQDGPGLAFGVRQQEEMAPAERAEVQEMQSRDASVRREEQAHRRRCRVHGRCHPIRICDRPRWPTVCGQRLRFHRRRFYFGRPEGNGTQRQTHGRGHDVRPSAILCRLCRRRPWLSRSR